MVRKPPAWAVPVIRPLPVGASVSANDDSIPAHIADTCANGTRKHKSGEPALIQQKSMACVFVVKESSRDASQIIQCDRIAVRGRRRKIQFWNEHFPLC